MTKELETLKTLVESSCFHFAEDLAKPIETALKALEIIKEKEMLSVFKDIRGKYFIAFNNMGVEISQEEYDLLKEVLL